MSRNHRGFTWLAFLLLLLGTAGCSTAPPEDQLKSISNGKKAQLTRFLESKQSRLTDYKATVTEEPNIDKDHTHVGLIEFNYAVTKPEGTIKEQTLNTAIAEYHFSRKEKKWVFKECSVKQGVGFLEPKEGFLVTPSEIKAVFEK